MIREDDHGLAFERSFGTRRHERLAQGIDVIDKRRRASVGKGHGEKIASTRDSKAAIGGHEAMIADHS
jgi:hypothetical protein